MKLRIATRKSALALWQAEHVAAKLNAFDEVDTVKLVPLSTRGDEILDRSLQKIGGKGLFIKELEVAMENGDADLAVHSMKDLPAELPEGFCVAATMARANHCDALIAGKRTTLDSLPERARVGSSSLRRQAQLHLLRPDLRVEPLRGNVNTRLAKLEHGDYDAIVLAAAGLERLQLDHYISHQFSTREMLPAAAQGVLGIECHESRSDIRALLTRLDDPRTVRTTIAERTIARELRASCQSPVAAFAEISDNRMTVTALVALPDGSESIREQVVGPPDQAIELGEQLAARLLDRGARELLDSIEHLHE